MQRLPIKQIPGFASPTTHDYLFFKSLDQRVLLKKCRFEDLRNLVAPIMSCISKMRHFNVDTTLG